MPALETAAILKLAFGISGVLFSIFKTGLKADGKVDYDETSKAIFGQVIGGIFYDLTKGGASASYEKLKSKYAKIDLSKDNLNHDLQKAARKSQLIATFFAAQYCLEQLNAENNQSVSVEGKSFWTKTAEKATKTAIKTKEIFIKDGQKEYLAEVIGYLNEEIKNVDNFESPESLNFEEIKEILENYKNSNSEDLQKSVSTSLKANMLAELEVVSKLPNSKFDQDAFNFLKTTIEDGWEELPKEKIVSEKFISLNIFQPKPSPKGKTYDWFNLLCSFFNEEYKTDARVEAAAQKQLLLNISNHFGKSETKISELVRKISEFAEDIAYIRKRVGDANLKLDKQQKTLEEIKQYVAPEKEGVPLNLVSLPDRKDKIYGRKEEIDIILNFLRKETKHGAIVTPTCFGKTSLIKKFLYKTTEGIYVKTEYEHLFQKVIYLYCYKNQVFQQIVKPFASLKGEILKYTEGDEANFLKQDVFDKLQSEKILLILDNFESWLDEDDNYLNKEIAVFLNTLFNSDCQIRAIFVSQSLPHSEREFFNKVVEIKGIEGKLRKGLDKESALELVKKEARKDIFGNVTDEELLEFFRKVHYIPQAIQSMMDFVDDEAITFDEFQTEFWEDFKKAENDPTKINDDTPQELRPTRALLSRQILKSDKPRQYLLSLLAFFESVVPKDLLLDDSGAHDLRQLRKALDRLVKNKLVMTEIDPLPELNEQTGKKTDIIYYSLHGFIEEIIRDVLPKFEEEYPAVLEKITDRMEIENRTAWEKKLFEKQLALAECWEKIETYFVINLKRTDRENYLDIAEFWKALALQETAFSANRKLSQEEISERVKNAEKLYLKFLDKYPKYAEAYNNLGILLAKDEKRWKEAEEKYNKAIELNPKYAAAYYNLGILLYLQNKLNAAIEASQMSANLDEKYSTPLVTLAAIYKKQGKREESKKYADKALALIKDDDYYNLACLNSTLEITDKALDFLRLAVKANPLLKSWAKKDPDFEGLRDDKRFREIVGEDGE